MIRSRSLSRDHSTSYCHAQVHRVAPYSSAPGHTCACARTLRARRDARTDALDRTRTVPLVSRAVRSNKSMAAVAPSALAGHCGAPNYQSYLHPCSRLGRRRFRDLRTLGATHVENRGHRSNARHSCGARCVRSEAHAGLEYRLHTRAHQSRVSTRFRRLWRAEPPSSLWSRSAPCAHARAGWASAREMCAKRSTCWVRM